MKVLVTLLGLFGARGIVSPFLPTGYAPASVTKPWMFTTYKNMSNCVHQNHLM